jgi:cytidine deaminase
MKEITIEFKAKIYQNLAEMPDSYQKLVMSAREAASRAYAPYSGYKVGAAVEMANGEVITGNNQENAAYPSGLCAERTALFYASSLYPGISVQMLAVSTFLNNPEKGEFAKPCGSCRQVIAEYEDLAGKPICLLLDGGGVIAEVEGVDTLLPFRFRKSDLG